MSEYCKYCGQMYGDARTLLHNTCTRHPGGRGNHALFEGDTNGPFYCVHCGQKYIDVDMVEGYVRPSTRTPCCGLCVRLFSGDSLYLTVGKTLPVPKNQNHSGNGSLVRKLPDSV